VIAREEGHVIETDVAVERAEAARSGIGWFTAAAARARAALTQLTALANRETRDDLALAVGAPGESKEFDERMDAYARQDRARAAYLEAVPGAHRSARIPTVRGRIPSGGRPRASRAAALR
jgi:hypothetical protein